ncbi:MAG: DNA-binding protein [Bacteroidetes bacterium]|nr:MAG: DNA-binding protein [Bacteroidota bacterium]
MNKYIIDANVLFSALISGKEIFIKLFENNLFYAPDFILIELDKYKSVVLNKSKLPIDYLQDFIQRVFKQITVIPELYITDDNKKKAIVLCQDIDIKDTAYIALSLEMDLPIVTRDKKLYNGLKKKGFESIILLDELFHPKQTNI